MTKQLFTDGILAAAGQLSTALLLGVAFAAAVTLQKLNKERTIKIFDFEIPRQNFFYAAIAYTAYHLYACVVFSSIVREALVTLPMHSYADTLRHKGPLLFLGMSDRIIVWERTFGNGGVLPLVYLPTHDPTTWLYHVFLALISFACWHAAEFASVGGYKFWCGAVALILSNWIIGSYWNYYVAKLQIAL